MFVPVKFEGVGTISVSGFLLQVARQVYDGQSPKWTFLKMNQEIKLSRMHKHDQIYKDFLDPKYTLIQIPQPMQRDSEIQTSLLWEVTSIHSLPKNTHVHVSIKQTPNPPVGFLHVIRTHAHHRAALFALLTTFLGFTFVLVHNSDSGVFVGHLGWFEVTRRWRRSTGTEEVWTSLQTKRRVTEFLK